MNEDFDRFEELILKWADAYVYTSHSYVAFKDKGTIRLLSGKIGIHTALRVPNPSPINVDTQHIIAGRFVQSAQRQSVLEMLKQARNGTIRAPEGEISLPRDHGPIQFYWADKPIPSRILVHGGQFASGMRDCEVHWELKTAPIAFDSLADLLAEVGSPQWKLGSGQTILEFHAAAPLMVHEDSTVAGGKAVIKLASVHGVTLAKIKVGLQVPNETQIGRSNIHGDQLEWNAHDGIQAATWLTPTGSAEKVEVYLSYDGVPLEQRSISDPRRALNIRHLIHDICDPNLETLKRVLVKPSKKDLNSFEAAVTILLSLLGFSTPHYGAFKALSDEPDIVATTPTASVAVVECTTAHINSDNKLAKLIGRTGMLKAKFSAAGLTFKIQPVIITPWSRDQILKGDLKTASDNCITVLCNEDLHKLLNELTSPTNADRIFENWQTIAAPSVFFNPYS